MMENSQFINERNKILSELDNYNMDDIINYSKKYNVPIPDEEDVILAGLHKARLYIENPIITEEMKEKSTQWLIEHGFNPFISNEKEENTMQEEKLTMQQMVNFFQDCRDKGLDMVIKLKMPNQEQPEIIMNYNKSIDAKLEYYQKTYTDDLVHKNNPDIQIIEILGTNIPF